MKNLNIVFEVNEGNTHAWVEATGKYYKVYLHGTTHAVLKATLGPQTETMLGRAKATAKALVHGKKPYQYTEYVT